MTNLDARILVDDVDEVVELLDDNGFDYDFDTAGRIMVATEDLDDIKDLLDAAGLDYEIIEY